MKESRKSGNHLQQQKTCGYKEPEDPKRCSMFPNHQKHVQEERPHPPGAQAHPFPVQESRSCLDFSSSVIVVSTSYLTGQVTKQTFDFFPIDRILQ